MEEMRNKIEFDTFYGEDGRKKVILKNWKGEDTLCDLANLVARTFTDICGVAPKDINIFPSFKDGNKDNCSAYNLYWPV